MKYSIRKLRIIALLLFITPAIALVGSLLFHNFLTIFKFTPDNNYNFTNYLPGNSVSVLCGEENNYCTEIKLKKFNKLNQCNLNMVNEYFTFEDGNIVKINNNEEIKNFNKKIFIKYELVDELNPYCILNSKYKSYYDLFPTLFETFYRIRTNERTNLGTSSPVNPFLYGETSISNIVKRFPVSYFFKPLLYISVIFMLLYWIYYNKIFKNIIKTTKNFYFFSFGILSGTFLLLHVFFLGWSFENEFLTKLRRTFVVFFIFFEVLAQAFLIKKIFFIKDRINNYLYPLIVYLKLFFVIAICLTTFLILILLMIFDFSSKVDYILEWNYFLVLLFFYYLSFLMWRKSISNPTSS